MLEVAGRPVLEHNVLWLRGLGVTEIAINLHHYPDVVTSYFGDGSRFGVDITYSWEQHLLGTAGGVAAAEAFLEQSRFIVLYADNLIQCSFTKLEALHVRERALVTIALFWRQDVRSSGVARLGPQDKLVGFEEKLPGLATSHWVSAGLLLCEPTVMQFIPRIGPSDFGRDVMPNIIANYGDVRGYRMTAPDEWLYWIDTPEDLARTRRAMRPPVP